MLEWKENENDTVTLQYKEGEVVVSKTDFNRAFGAMVNATYGEVARDYGNATGVRRMEV